MKKFNILKISTLFIILLAIYGSVLASGSYSPSGTPLTKTSYTKGKAIYHGRLKIDGFPGCVSCHDAGQKLQKKNFIKVGIEVEPYMRHCDELEECKAENVSNMQWEALVYFLQKRYRINKDG